MRQKPVAESTQARKVRAFRALDYSAFVAIGAALCYAGVALYTTPNIPLDPFKVRGFTAGTAFAAFVILAYAAREKVGALRRPGAAPRPHGLPRHHRPPGLREFAAGALTCMFVVGLVEGVYAFGQSVAAGNPAWLPFAASVVLGGLGIALGVGLFAGMPLALRIVWPLLLMSVAGGILAAAASFMGIPWAFDGQLIADVVVSLGVLLLISRGT
jgi:hypothetical protein